MAIGAVKADQRGLDRVCAGQLREGDEDCEQERCGSEVTSGPRRDLCEDGVVVGILHFCFAFTQTCEKKPPERTSSCKRFCYRLGARCVSLGDGTNGIMRLNSESSEDVTALLLNWQSGDDEDAPAKLMPLVYEELRRVARGYLQRERGDHTLQATALVHEAYLQLFDDRKVTWKDRAHFYGVAARLMRQILIAARAGASCGQARRA